MVELAYASPYEHSRSRSHSPCTATTGSCAGRSWRESKAASPAPGAPISQLLSGSPVEDATYQFGIDLMREGLDDPAFSWFVSQCQQCSEAAQTVLGRWVLMSLIEAGRASEALDLALDLRPAHAAHPGLLLLALLAAMDARRPIDIGGGNRGRPAARQRGALRRVAGKPRRAAHAAAQGTGWPYTVSLSDRATVLRGLVSRKARRGEDGRGWATRPARPGPSSALSDVARRLGR